MSEFFMGGGDNDRWEEFLAGIISPRSFWGSLWPEGPLQKFLWGPGAVFLKRAPGRRRQRFIMTAYHTLKLSNAVIKDEPPKSGARRFFNSIKSQSFASPISIISSSGIVTKKISTVPYFYKRKKVPRNRINITEIKKSPEGFRLPGLYQDTKW